MRGKYRKKRVEIVGGDSSASMKKTKRKQKLLPMITNILIHLHEIELLDSKD